MLDCPMVSAGKGLMNDDQAFRKTIRIAQKANKTDRISNHAGCSATSERLRACGATGAHSYKSKQTYSEESVILRL